MRFNFNNSYSNELDIVNSVNIKLKEKEAQIASKGIFPSLALVDNRFITVEEHPITIVYPVIIKPKIVPKMFNICSIMLLISQMPKQFSKIKEKTINAPNSKKVRILLIEPILVKASLIIVVSETFLAPS